MTEFDRYEDPATGKHSRAFHVDFTSHHAALPKAKGAQLMRDVAAHLGARRPQGHDEAQPLAPPLDSGDPSNNRLNHGSDSGGPSAAVFNPVPLPAGLASVGDRDRLVPLPLPAGLAVEGRYRYDLLPASRGGTAPVDVKPGVKPGGLAAEGLATHPLATEGFKDMGAAAVEGSSRSLSLVVEVAVPGGGNLAGSIAKWR
jgi:hypothetical protein